jgi:hypothetical protein
LRKIIGAECLGAPGGFRRIVHHQADVAHAHSVHDTGGVGIAPPFGVHDDLAIWSDI